MHNTYSNLGVYMCVYFYANSACSLSVYLPEPGDALETAKHNGVSQEGTRVHRPDGQEAFK